MADLSYFTLTEHTTRFDTTTAAAYADELIAKVSGSRRMAITRIAEVISGLLQDAHLLAEAYIYDGLDPNVHNDWAFSPGQRAQVLTLIDNATGNALLLTAELRKRSTPDGRRSGWDPLIR